MIPQHGPFSLHPMLDGPWLHKTAFPTPMVRPLDESQGSSPLQGHGSWLMCEVALSLLQLATSPFLSLLLIVSPLCAIIRSRSIVRWWEYALGMQVYVMQLKFTLSGQRGPFWTLRRHTELLLLNAGVDIYIRNEPFGEGSTQMESQIKKRNKNQQACCASHIQI